MHIFECRAAVIAAALVAAMTAGTAQAALVSITPSASSVSVGDVFSVRLGISDLTSASGSSLSAFDFTLSFDNTAVQWLGFSLLDAATGSNQLDFAEASSFGFIGDVTDTGGGSLRAFGLSGNTMALLDALQADAFDFVTLSFQALAPRASAGFAIDTADPTLLFVDSDAAQLGVAFAAPASVAIGDGAAVPEPASLLLVLLALASMLGLRPRARQRGGWAAPLVVALAGAAGAVAAAEPAATSAAAAARTPISGTVVQVQGQRLKVKAANGVERWYTTGTPLTPQHTGKRIRGDARPVGDTVLIERPVFE